METRGTWARWIFGPRAVVGAAVICPHCGKGMSVGGDPPFGSVHRIGSRGEVSPSLVCPWCSWHTSVRLAGWPGARGVLA